jgi:hypothetical protein
MLGKVTTWQMTEEERLAYIAKYPITKKEKEKKKKGMMLDYKWRGIRAAETQQVKKRTK